MIKLVVICASRDLVIAFLLLRVTCLFPTTPPEHSARNQSTSRFPVLEWNVSQKSKEKKIDIKHAKISVSLGSLYHIILESVKFRAYKARLLTAPQEILDKPAQFLFSQKGAQNATREGKEVHPTESLGGKLKL